VDYGEIELVIKCKEAKVSVGLCVLCGVLGVFVVTV
jgi:hypothetical protein